MSVCAKCGNGGQYHSFNRMELTNQAYCTTCTAHYCYHCKLCHRLFSDDKTFVETDHQCIPTRQCTKCQVIVEIGHWLEPVVEYCGACVSLD